MEANAVGAAANVEDAIAPTQEQVEKTGKAIKDFVAANEVQLAEGVGRLLVEGLSGGRIDVWLSKAANKKFSLRDVAKVAGKSATYLRRALHIHLLSRTHDGLWAWPSLTVTHFRAVIGKPPEEQKRLLDSAERERWDSSRLEHEAGTLPLRKPLENGTEGLAKLEALQEVSRALHSFNGMLNDSDGVLADAVTAGVPAVLVLEFEQAVAHAQAAGGRIREYLETAPQLEGVSPPAPAGL